MRPLPWFGRPPNPLTLSPLFHALLLATTILVLLNTAREAASAPGINLSWDDCGTAGSEIKTFACDQNGGLPFTLVGSFKPPSGMTSMVGLSAEMGITGTSALPDWWKHGEGHCRNLTGLGTDFDFTENTACTDWTRGRGVGGFAYDVAYGGPNFARLRLQAAIPIDDKLPLDPEAEYYAFKVQFLPNRVVDSGACAGCSTPLAIRLREIQLFQPPENAFDPVIVSPLTRTATFWQAKISVPDPPVITSFSPESGEIGSDVEIHGSNLATVTRVRFNQIEAEFTIDSDLKLTTHVPSGASDGVIVVEGPGGYASTPGPFDVRAPLPPVVQSFSPQAGTPGQMVTITGANFNDVTSVRLGSIYTTFTVNSSSTIEMTVPQAALTGRISVTTSAGSATSAQDFIVAPVLVSVQPDAGVVGAAVNLQGTNLTYVTSVKFNGVDATFQIRSPGLIVTSVPQNATTGFITVTNPGGTFTTPVVFTVRVDQSPRIDSVEPAAGPPGTEVVVRGARFVNVLSVRLDNQDVSFTVASDNTIRMTVPANGSTGRITVTTAGGTAASSSDFIVAPVVTSFTPSQGPAGTGVDIIGRNLTHVTHVSFNAANATFQIAGTNRIVATVPATATSGPITIVNPGGTYTTPTVFTVREDLSPRIDSIEPTAGPPGSEVLIRGARFANVTAVRLSNQNTIFVVLSDSTIRMTVPTGGLTGRIVVTTANGTATSPVDFIVAPVVTSITPSRASAGAQVEIAGTNLAYVTRVSFNATDAAFLLLSASRIRATVPPTATTGPITVVNPGGQFVTPTAFTVTPPETLRVDRFEPASGPIGTPVYVYGNKFLAATSVHLGNQYVQFQVQSNTELRMIVPSYARTGRIRVTTNDGMTAESPSDFVVVDTTPVAGGINLSWDDCGIAGLRVKQFACDANSGVPFTLVGSFVPPSNVTDFLGVSADLMVESDDALPDWWKHGAGQCRGVSSLSTDFNFTSGPFTCADVYAGAAAGGFAYDVGFGAANRARLRIQGAVPIDNRTALDAATEYYAFKLAMMRSRTTGPDACSGCDVPVKITLQSIQLFQPPEKDFDPTLTRPLDGTTAFWQREPDSVPTIGPNLVSNPSFEGSVWGWAPLIGSSLAHAIGDGRTGGSAMKAVAPAAGGEFGVSDSPSTIESVLEAGLRFRFGAWVKTTAQAVRPQLRVREKFAYGDPVQTVVSNWVRPSPEWQYLQVDITVQNAGSELDFAFLSQMSTSSADFLIDDVTVQQLGTAPIMTSSEDLTTEPLLPIAIEVTANDPSGEAIRELEADLSDLPTDHNATFTVDLDKKRGVVSWIPRIEDGGGTYTVTFRARSLLEHTVSTRITVRPAANAGGAAINPSFEGPSLYGWNGIKGAILTTASPGRSGSYSLLLTGSGYTFGTTDSPNIISKKRSEELTRYRYTCWVRGVANGGKARVRVREYQDSTRVYTSYSEDIPLTTAWRKLAVEHVATAPHSTLDFAVLCQGAYMMYVDDVSVIGSPTVAGPGRTEEALASVVALAPPRVVPNPVRGSAMLEMTLARRGPLRVELFDVNGRRVRSVFQQDDAEAGLHQFDIGAGGGRSERLGPGVFFYRIENAGVVKKGRFVVLE